jgi:hypothetical protein
MINFEQSQQSGWDRQNDCAGGAKHLRASSDWCSSKVSYEAAVQNVVLVLRLPGEAFCRMAMHFGTFCHKHKAMLGS